MILRSVLASALMVSLAACDDEDDAPPPPPMAGAPSAFVAIPQAPPAGSVAMSVARVERSYSGYTVLLQDGLRTQFLPIMVGEAEGSAIDRRLHALPAARPMTHDLLDDVIRRLGGRVTMVEIDAMDGEIFLAKLHVSDGVETHRIDARSSDAIAIALGHGAPVYVSQHVLGLAGTPALPY